MRERHKDKEAESLCYAFGYLAAACRGEIEPVLSEKRVAEWIEARLSPEQVASGEAGRLIKKVYGELERLAVGSDPTNAETTLD